MVCKQLLTDSFVLQDEAFELGQLWAHVYDEGSTSRDLISKVFDTYYLVNIVRNDYRNPDPFAIFSCFLGEAKPNGVHHDFHLSKKEAEDGLTSEAIIGH